MQKNTTESKLIIIRWRSCHHRRNYKIVNRRIDSFALVLSDRILEKSYNDSIDSLVVTNYSFEIEIWNKKQIEDLLFQEGVDFFIDEKGKEFKRLVTPHDSPEDVPLYEKVN